MDSFALGLIKAAEIIEDGRIDTFLKERYSSYSNGIGKKISDRTATLDELDAYARGLWDITTNISGRQEYLESIVNDILFGERS